MTDHVADFAAQLLALAFAPGRHGARVRALALLGAAALLETKRPPAVRAAGGPEGSGRRGERSEPTNLNPSGSREGPGLPSMKVRYRTFLDPTQAPGRSRVVSEKLAGGLGLQTLTTEGTPEAAPGVRCPLCDRLSLRRVACGSCGGVAGGCIDCDGEAGWLLCDYADDDCTPTLYRLDPLGAPAVLP